MSRELEKEVLFVRLPKKLKVDFQVKCVRTGKRQDEVIIKLVKDFLRGDRK